MAGQTLDTVGLLLRGSWGPDLFLSGMSCNARPQAPAGRVGVRIPRDAPAPEELDWGILVWSSGGTNVSADSTGPPRSPFGFAAEFLLQEVPMHRTSTGASLIERQVPCVPGESRLIPQLLHRGPLVKG